MNNRFLTKKGNTMTNPTFEQFIASRFESDCIVSDVPSYCCDKGTKGFVYASHGAVIEKTSDGHLMLMIENTSELSDNLQDLESKLFNYLQLI